MIKIKINKNVVELLNNTNPKNIVNTMKEINMCVFNVKIKYVTSRNNTRERNLVFIIDTVNPQYDTTNKINEWVKEYNSKRNSQKQISNVKILESFCEGIIRI